MAAFIINVLSDVMAGGSGTVLFPLCFKFFGLSGKIASVKKSCLFFSCMRVLWLFITLPSTIHQKWLLNIISFFL